jgi:regulator of replication initiation timing
LSVLGARESDTALLLEEIERLHLQADAAIEHNARLLSEVSQLREALEVKESEYQSTIRKCNQSTQACLQLREERQKHIDALKEIRDLGTSSNYTVNVAVLTAQAALGIGE